MGPGPRLCNHLRLRCALRRIGQRTAPVSCGGRLDARIDTAAADPYRSINALPTVIAAADRRGRKIVGSPADPFSDAAVPLRVANKSRQFPGWRHGWVGELYSLRWCSGLLSRRRRPPVKASSNTGRPVRGQAVPSLPCHRVTLVRESQTLPPEARRQGPPIHGPKLGSRIRHRFGAGSRE